MFSVLSNDVAWYCEPTRKSQAIFVSHPLNLEARSDQSGEMAWRQLNGWGIEGLRWYGDVYQSFPWR